MKFEMFKKLDNTYIKKIHCDTCSWRMQNRTLMQNKQNFGINEIYPLLVRR